MTLCVISRWTEFGRVPKDPSVSYSVGPPWPNGQGAPLLRVRLWVRVPLGVTKIFCVFKFYFCRGKTKITTPCGIQTHNLQIRSLTRCSIAPTGQAVGSEETAPFRLCAFLSQKKVKSMLQEGLEPPTLGLLDPCSTKLSYQSCTVPTLGIEPRTFRSSV